MESLLSLITFEPGAYALFLTFFFFFLPVCADWESALWRVEASLLAPKWTFADPPLSSRVTVWV